MIHSHIYLLFLTLFLTLSIVPAQAESISKTVTRAEVLKIAKTYCDLEWTAEKKHAFHGKDSNGISVNTPDSSYRKDSKTSRGWWKVEGKNKGLPYQWGGFDTPQSFLKKINSGHYAGDIYTSKKRKQLNSGISKQACGIDCSGFVSRCWKLPHAYSTRTLPSLCRELKNWHDLLPGDILNTHNGHCMIFSHFTNPEKSRMLVYQAGAPPISKTQSNQESVTYLKSQGYKAHRYKNIKP